VWICPLPNGHLQAIGYDARGRKQYRYHPLWREVRDEDKFSRLMDFGQSLPTLRKRVQQDLALASRANGAPAREHLLATLVRLLDATHIRVGNESYTRENNSFGLTTLRNRHAKVEGHRVCLRFRGKSGVWHEVALEDPRVARVVRRCQTLPGQDLFQYADEDGSLHGIGSAEVNTYIREASGGDFTAKDFRTWHASVHAWALLAPEPAASARQEAAAQRDNPEMAQQSQAATTRTVVEALKEVAARLGNTVAVCRKSYVHPMVLACATANEWPKANKRHAARYEIDGLDDNERGLLCFLDAALAETSKDAAS
jgi:DNA topoisomerase-1